MRRRDKDDRSLLTLTIAGGDAGEPGECPFLADDDARCAKRFVVDNLDDFYSLCCGSYRRCQTYHQIRGDAIASAAPASLNPVALTSDGQPLRIRSHLP